MFPSSLSHTNHFDVGAKKGNPNNGKIATRNLAAPTLNSENKAADKSKLKISLENICRIDYNNFSFPPLDPDVEVTFQKVSSGRGLFIEHANYLYVSIVVLLPNQIGSFPENF